MRKFGSPLLLALAAILAALSTIKFESNPLVPGRDTGFRTCDSMCARDSTLWFSAEVNGDSARLTLRVAAMAALTEAEFSATVGTTRLLVRRERVIGDSLAILAITGPEANDHLFRWPPGATLQLAAFQVDTLKPPPPLTSQNRSRGGPPVAPVVKRSVIPLQLRDWQLATLGGADDSMQRAARRQTARVVYAVGLVGLVLSAGVTAWRAKPTAKESKVEELSVEVCINRMIEEIGASGRADADKQVLILRGTVQGTMSSKEVLQRLSPNPKDLPAAIRLIKETRESLVYRVRTLATRLERKAAELDAPADPHPPGTHA